MQLEKQNSTSALPLSVSDIRPTFNENDRPLWDRLLVSLGTMHFNRDLTGMKSFELEF